MSSPVFTAPPAKTSPSPSTSRNNNKALGTKTWQGFLGSHHKMGVSVQFVTSQRAEMLFSVETDALSELQQLDRNILLPPEGRANKTQPALRVGCS